MKNKKKRQNNNVFFLFIIIETINWIDVKLNHWSGMFSPAIELLYLIECQMVIATRFLNHISILSMKIWNSITTKNAQLSIQKRETNQLATVARNQWRLQIVNALNVYVNWLLPLINTLYLKAIRCLKSFSLSRSFITYSCYVILFLNAYKVICVVSWITYTITCRLIYFNCFSRAVCILNKPVTWKYIWCYVIGCIRFWKGLFEVSMKLGALWSSVW